LIVANVEQAKDKKKSEEVWKLSFYDPLTNLPNRRLLDDRITKIMAASKRNGSHAALMMLDLDNFKTLNDLHGHLVGDLLLVEVGRRLMACVREMDTVARFGGDEFVVVLGELDADRVKSTEQARDVAEKVCFCLSQPYLLKVQSAGSLDRVIEHRCSASVGVVVFFDHELSQDDVLKLADAAMYQAKAAGRNAIRFQESSGQL
jgi:diguanylate cyclase (GGDEF)-like protein